MKRFLLFLLTTTLSFVGLSQAPAIDIGPDTVTCPPDCVTLTAEFVGGGNTTDYTVTAITYAPDPYTGTGRFLSDDAVSGPIAIGFSFCFYGNTYTNVNISSNGWIGFSGGPGTFTTSPIPSVAASTPKNCIMGPWHDINPGIGGSVLTQTLGVAPFRRFVVTWQAVPYFSCTGLLATQQIILYETTNVIENHIQNKVVCAGWAGGTAVQGVHNSPGTAAVVYPGRNSTVWTAFNHAIRYTPLGDPIIEWYSGPFLIGTGPTRVVCPAVPTTYVAKLISCGGVVDADTIFVDVICCEPPTMSSVPASCFGECDGTATAEGIGVAPFTYLWDAGAGSQTTATATGLCAGTYTVTVTDALGCVETGTVTVTEASEITGLVTATTVVTCYGFNDGTGTVVGSGGTGVLTYDIGAGPMPTGYFTGLAPATYIVTIMDEAGCFIEIPLPIVSPDSLEVDLILTSDVSCNGGSDGAITIDAIGGVEPFEFAIDAGPYAPTGVFTGLTAGVHDVEILDANGCLANATITLTQPTPLTLDLVSSVSITCFGGSDGEIVVVAGGGVPGYSYSIDGGAFGPLVTFTGLDAGTHTIIVKDANDCETELDVILTESPAVDVNEIIVSETCLGDCLGSITLEGTVGVAPFEYSIDDCATTDLVGVYTGLCAGSFDICVVDADGCTYTNTIIVPDGVVPADASIIPFGPMCINDAPHTLTAISPGGVYTGTGVVGGAFDPALAGIGTHTITNTIAVGCGDIATFNVVVNPLPVVGFTSPVTDGCQPLFVPFDYTGEPGSACVWTFGDGDVSDICGDANHTYYNVGTYDVSLTVTDLNGCTNSTTAYDYIDVYPLPNASFRFGPQPTTTINTEINFTDMSTNADSWTWTFDVLGNSSEQNPTYTFPEIAASYTIDLFVANEYGCVDSTSRTLIIAEQYLIYVPNTVTPDGDLYNEVFKPYFNGIDIYNYSLMIYNRYGEILFESHDVNVGWNGTYGGELVPSGVYVWHIITDEASSDKKLEYQGHVTVLR